MATPILPRAQSQVVDTRGLANREWYDFFSALLDFVGESSELGPVIADILARLDALENDETAGNIFGQGSVKTIGSLSNGTVWITLQNDNPDPGNTYYYGTGPDGVKGFFPISDALIQGDGIALTINADGTIDIAHADTSSVADISANFTGGTVPAEISQTYDQFGHVLTTTITGRTLEHNDTGGKQGGTAGEYFHFTEDEHTALVGLSDLMLLPEVTL